MTDDRFGDLGAERRSGPEHAAAPARSAAERFAELDEREPEQQPEAPRPPRPGSRYSWVVGIAFLIAIIVAGLNAVTSEGPGLTGPEPGDPAPVFVAPLAVSGLDRDANADRRRVCGLRIPETVNTCILRREGPFVLTFFFTRFADCGPQLDRVEQASREVPGVRWVGVIVRSGKADAARLVREKGWRFPVALDRDGLVSNIYGISGCPTTVFVNRGGDVGATRLGEVGVADLVREARRLR